MLGMFDELRNFSLFKTEEEKRKEYEDNIAKNVAAMEIANLPPERETFADVAKFEEIVVSVPANIVLLVT